MPDWVKPYLTGVLTTALVAGTVLLLTRPRHDTIEVLIATPVPATIAVAVSGEVARPGLYHLPAGSRVADLLQRAGLSERADPAVPSRALLLRDEMQIHVPAVGGGPASAGTAVTVPTSTLVAAPPTVGAGAPAGIPAATAPASLTATPPVALAATTAPAAGPTPSPVVAAPTLTPALSQGERESTVVPTAVGSGPLNLNTATAGELERLPGIGSVLAARIVADRERNGPFRTVDELARVNGIGPTILARVRPLVTV